MEIESGKPFGNLPITAKKGYRFVEWIDYRGTPFSTDSASYIDLTLYARWEKVVETITLTFYIEGSTDSFATAKIEKGKPFGTLPTPPEKPGYIFMSWADRHGMPFYPESTCDIDLTLYATWRVDDRVLIHSHPQDQTVSEDTWAQFKIEAKSNPTQVEYQWQYRIGNGNFINFSASDSSWASDWTNNVLSIRAEKSKHNVEIRCMVSNGGNSEYLDAARLTISFSRLVITQQPKNRAEDEGESVSFSVEVSGGRVPYNYQWYSDDGVYTDSLNISGSQTPTITINKLTASQHGDMFYCVITDSDTNRVVSEKVKVTVLERLEDLRFNFQPTNQTVPLGGTAQFSVDVAGGTAPYYYEWCDGTGYYNDVGFIEGSTSPTITVRYISMYQNNQAFCCIVTDSEGKTITSETVYLTVS